MLENRPIVTIAIGYIIGIIMGLYCKISIVLCYLLIFFIYQIAQKIAKPVYKFKLISFRRYFRYIKIIITKKVLIIIIISSIISNFIILYQNQKFQDLYSGLDNQDVEVIATVVSKATEKNNKKIYKVKVENINQNSKYKGTYLYLNINKNLKQQLEFGNKIYINGEFREPATRSNYKGFDYKEYLKTLKIYGTINLKKINKISNNNLGFTIKISKMSNSVFLRIKDLIQSNFEKDNANILLGAVLGYTDEFNEEIKNNFTESNISHLLAISGMHVGYIIILTSAIFKHILGKRKGKIITSIILVIYMFIIGFSASAIRATIMAEFMIFASIFYRKSDIWQNLSLAILILLIYNPFLIKDVGLWLSFAGTIGIVSLKRLKKHELIYLTISANLGIMPIMAVCFNKIAISSLIISMIIGVIVGPLVMVGFLFITMFHFIDVLNLELIKIFFIKTLSFLSTIIIEIAKFGSKLPLNKIYVTTPSLFEIIIYYITIIIGCFLIFIYRSKKQTAFNKRVKNLISLLKFKIRENKKKILSIILIFSIVLFTIKITPKKLKIYFIDVGQGDSCLIITPNNQNILIDGGGSETYDVGKNTLLPYLLDRGIKKIDYMIISHFDTDHVGRSTLCDARDKSKKCDYR